MEQVVVAQALQNFDFLSFHVMCLTRPGIMLGMLPCLTKLEVSNQKYISV